MTYAYPLKAGYSDWAGKSWKKGINDD
jgi:hypothetical protein